MNLPIVVKLCSLVFCVIGAVFLNFGSMTWFHDILSLGLCGYVLILTICVIVLIMNGQLDHTLDYMFMLIGAVLNYTGGLIAIIYYCDSYERYTFEMPASYLLGVGIFALLAALCMTADLVKNIFKVFGTS